MQFERPLSEPELEVYRGLIARRGEGRPVAYLTGHKEFMKLDFDVTADVLIPNPDTETLVQRAVVWCRERGQARVADVGTGSGCIAVAVAHYVPRAVVYAIDDSQAALAIAARNVHAHGLDDRITLLEGDLLDPLPANVDLICANLPYVGEAAEVPTEVRAQPTHALFAGEGGLEVVRRLLEAGPSRLDPGGAVLAEIDPSLASRLDLSAYAGHRFHKDLGGHVRVVEAWP